MKSERFRAPLRVETSFSLRYSSSARRKNDYTISGIRSHNRSCPPSTHLPSGQRAPYGRAIPKVSNSNRTWSRSRPGVPVRLHCDRDGPGAFDLDGHRTLEQIDA